MHQFVSLSLCLISLVFISKSSPNAAAHVGEEGLSAYEVLQSYDFPVGILPIGAIGYDLDQSTGKFSAYFGGSCSFSLQGSYQLRYKSTIRGKIAKDKLSNLSGVSVKVLFLWLNIVEVSRKGDKLEFSVGITSADFTLDNFEISPQCGCGFDCNSIAQPSEIKANMSDASPSLLAASR